MTLPEKLRAYSETLRYAEGDTDLRDAEGDVIERRVKLSILLSEEMRDAMALAADRIETLEGGVLTFIVGSP